MSLIGFKARNHPQQCRNATVDDRATTPEVFAGFDERFHFTLDAAASPENAKLPRFHSIEDDGLAQDWSGERVWVNPPYSDIEPWVVKANAETGADLVVMLLPANRTEQGWWQREIEMRRRAGAIDVEFLEGRMRFLNPGDDAMRPNARPPFGVCLVIWGLR